MSSSLPITNPLLDFTDTPRYADIKPEHVAEAVKVCLEHAKQALSDAEQLSDAEVSWERFIEPLEEATEQLSRVWGVVSHLHHVVDTPEWREVYNAHLEEITVFWTLLGQSETLLKHYTTLSQEPQFSQLSPTRQYIVQNALRDFKLSGALLADTDKARFVELSTKLSAQQAKFSENTLDATNAYSYYASESEVVGIPQEVLDAMRAAAEADEHTGYKITLHFPSYFPIMQYAQDRALRERIYKAYVTRASDLGTPELDNSAVMQDILSLRQQLAQLLGFNNYAEVSLASKMADSVTQVTDFLNNLAQKARPSAVNDYQQLKEFAASHLGLADLQPWDMTFASEKLREQRYAFSEQEVKNHFPLSKVLNGLFYVIESLFDVRMQPAQAQVWHPDVQFFELHKNGQIIGGVYLDPYVRTGKNQGAWMDEVRARTLKSSGLQTPIALMVCNFTPPLEGQETTLTHDDVITLFHESGHALHHLLTQVDDAAVSGIRGVEWDAVELPSQFMENFCWDFDILTRMSAHIQTGQPLSIDLYNKMLAAKNFQSGLQMLRQVEFSLYDIELHEGYQASEPQAIFDVLKAVRARIAVIPTTEYNRFQHSFGHIFAGGYSAGYYSYKWAEVLSADVFSTFELAHKHGKTNLLNQELGQQYWHSILAVGGSRPAMASFKEYMGREPNVDALLRHSGLAA